MTYREQAQREIERVLDGCVRPGQETQFAEQIMDRLENLSERHVGAESTKSRSYSLLDIPEVDAKVLKFIKTHPRMSRFEVSVQAQVKLQTVCGAVHRLISSSLVRVTGEKLDTRSNRHVEVLEAI